MIRLEDRRAYGVPRQAAFDYITDPANWPDYWPDLVAVAEPERARWRQPGDTMRLRMRLAGRERDLNLTLVRLDAPALVTYRSTQLGLPDVAHERHFDVTARGFDYRLVVAYEPRRGLAGLVDRTVVRRGIQRALRRTLDNLERRLGEVR